MLASVQFDIDSTESKLSVSKHPDFLVKPIFAEPFIVLLCKGFSVFRNLFLYAIVIAVGSTNHVCRGVEPGVLDTVRKLLWIVRFIVKNKETTSEYFIGSGLGLDLWTMEIKMGWQDGRSMSSIVT